MSVREVKTIVISRNGAWKKNIAASTGNRSPSVQLPCYKDPSQSSRDLQMFPAPREWESNIHRPHLLLEQIA